MKTKLKAVPYSRQNWRPKSDRTERRTDEIVALAVASVIVVAILGVIWLNLP
jgi:hypothetical protein